MVLQRGTKIPGIDGQGPKKDIQAKKQLSIGFDFFSPGFGSLSFPNVSGSRSGPVVYYE